MRRCIKLTQSKNHIKNSAAQHTNATPKTRLRATGRQRLAHARQATIANGNQMRPPEPVAPTAHPQPPDLSEVATAWTTLPEALKSGIVAIATTHRGHPEKPTAGLWGREHPPFATDPRQSRRPPNPPITPWPLRKPDGGAMGPRDGPISGKSRQRPKVADSQCTFPLRKVSF